MTKKKHILITLKERNGEQEYTQKVLRTIGAKANANKAALNVAKHWYGNGTKSEGTEKIDEKTYEHLFGCIHVTVIGIENVSEADFEVLNRYM